MFWIESQFTQNMEIIDLGRDSQQENACKSPALLTHAGRFTRTEIASNRLVADLAGDWNQSKHSMPAS
jgi:hypothetical protein